MIPSLIGVTNFVKASTRPLLNFGVVVHLVDSAGLCVVCGRWLSAVPRVAGTEADLMQARSLQQLWKDQGLDNSGVETYDVLLSYPGNDSAPNKVREEISLGTM